MKVALIPARGGSKRIPRKNIKQFNGKPIIAYSIEAAQKSGCFDRIIVSTDDKEIADIAKQYDAEVPFLRPADVSDDYATTAQVIKHALDWLEQQGAMVSYLCCIYATAPFLRVSDLKASFELLLASKGAQYCFPVCEYPFPIQRGVKITEQGRVTMFQPKHLNTRSQDLEKAYHDVGQFYWGTPKAYHQQIPMFSELAVPYPISRKRVVDFDTPADWEFALLLSKVLNDKA